MNIKELKLLATSIAPITLFLIGLISIILFFIHIVHTLTLYTKL